MRSYKDISYGKLGHPLQKLDIFMPDEGDSFPVFIYIHGGGIKNGDKAADHLCSNFEILAKRNIASVSINYRLYPDTKYPEFIEDSAEAVAWVFENIKDYFSPKGIFLGGSSAGGYLTMMLCFDKRWLGKHGLSPLDITGYIHDAGQPTAHFTVLKYAGIDSKRVIIDETAPIFHIGCDEEYAPMLFIVSDNDRQNRYEQTLLTISTLKHFGHTEPKIRLKVMENCTHCRYTKEPVFADIISDYISSVQ